MLPSYKLSLISLFAKVHELKDTPENTNLCLEIQETLIRRITYIERKIRNLKSQINDYKKRLRIISAVRLTKSESTDLKENIGYCRYLIDQYANLIAIFKEVGDAIAFIYIDKWDIKPLAFKQSAGFLSGKKGSRLERKILRQSFGMGVTVILNDLTNCLRYSDITVPNQGKFMLIEAKSGKKHRPNKRDKRQFELTRNVTDYLGSDLTQALYGKEGMFIRAAFQTNEKNHINRLNEVIKDAFNKGFGFAEVEEGVFYYAATRFNETFFKGLVERLEQPKLGISISWTIQLITPLLCLYATLLHCMSFILCN